MKQSPAEIATQHARQDRLRKVASDLSNARHGQKQAILDREAAELGVTIQTLCRWLKSEGFDSGRKTRADKGKSAVTLDQVVELAAMLSASKSKTGKQQLPATTAAKNLMAQSNPDTGELLFAQVKASTWTRRLRELGLNRKVLDVPSQKKLWQHSRDLARNNFTAGSDEAMSIEAISNLPESLRKNYTTAEKLHEYLNSAIDNGKISVDKLLQLEKLYKAMGQTSEKLNSDLHRVMTGESLVLVARAEPEAGFAIPQKARLRSTNKYTPDSAKLESLEVETAMVAQKLDGYFQTDERQSTTNSATLTDKSANLTAKSGDGLERNYQELLHRLLGVSHLSHKD